MIHFSINSSLGWCQVFCAILLLTSTTNAQNQIVNADTKSLPIIAEEDRSDNADHKVASDSSDKILANASKLPNIVLMLVDDLGYGDLSSAGHPTSFTPVLDKLAEQSKIFTQFYVTSPVCSPSRASLLTGRYQVRSGVYPGTFNSESIYGLPTNETTLADLLQTKGYRTLISGKWHLGVGENGEYLPAHHGFDDYFGVPYSHDMCPCRVCYPNDGPCYDLCREDMVSCPLYSNTTIIEQPVYLPTLSQRLVDKAVTFMQESVRDSAPFFLYMPFMHVHHPQYASSDHQGTAVRGKFGDSLEELESSVDQLLQQLEQLGVTNDTLVWFSSDNGPSITRHERGGCAGPLRCGKATTWDGGVRVPAFVRWPGIIKPERNPELVTALEVLPTFASLLGIDTSDLLLDGMDMSELLLGINATSPREFFAVYPANPSQDIGAFAVVWGRLKAHFYTIGSGLSDNDNYDTICTEAHHLTKHDPPLLFDLSVDPGERWNVASSPQYSDALNTMIAWRKQHMAAMSWMPPLTRIEDPHAQPCCTKSDCDPFPACCDCAKQGSVWKKLYGDEL